MPIDTTVFILTILFALIIGAFILRFIVRSTIDSSMLMKKVEEVEAEIAELKSELCERK
ncbi:hypothetical protein ACFQ38_04230 [Sporosarcina contaminans]|uniref:DUF4083 domain-containing protein n=1 Tax=Sporosarcina contaminans TaxID=633403 RepID=A0ABW3TU91_9BACL